MRLDELLATLGSRPGLSGLIVDERHVDPAAVEILSVTHDSADAEHGTLFCCVPGRHTDGHGHGDLHGYRDGRGRRGDRDHLQHHRQSRITNHPDDAAVGRGGRALRQDHHGHGRHHVVLLHGHLQVNKDAQTGRDQEEHAGKKQPQRGG